MSNVKEYSVSELSTDVKRVVEDSFSYIRVRGELGRVTRAGSGHVYLDMKDDRAVISAVIWKGNAAKLAIQPEQGMEMIATGRMTTFPGQSKYQLVVDKLEPAGVGALMALLEERKKKLAAEGLFEESRKKAIPFLPQVIGVVTSPSGAVIRDILHRLRDRFPSHVIVWPTLVQGEGAAKKVAEGVKGFNAIDGNGNVPRPDVLIVARGGGSIEDLWGFNEEVVARAVAESDIPVISAVGHETDTTLIDFVSDRRAPTPTAAAEMAVPVRRELWLEIQNKLRRLNTVQQRVIESSTLKLTSVARGLGRAENILDTPTQRLDRASERLGQVLTLHVERAGNALTRYAAGLKPSMLSAGLKLREERLSALSNRFAMVGKSQLQKREERVSGVARLLESFSYKKTLERGFSLVTDENGKVVKSTKALKTDHAVTLSFMDGEVGAIANPSSGEKPKKAPAKKAPTKKAAPKSDDNQSSLFD